MKKADIEKILEQHPNALFAPSNGRGNRAFAVLGFVKPDTYYYGKAREGKTLYAQVQEYWVTTEEDGTHTLKTWGSPSRMTLTQISHKIADSPEAFFERQVAARAAQAQREQQRVLNIARMRAAVPALEQAFVDAGFGRKFISSHSETTTLELSAVEVEWLTDLLKIAMDDTMHADATATAGE